MKEIRLNKLIIENFKGIKKLNVNFDGESVNVHGTNETGKTTLIDAFTWCLFGKDSLGSSNFAIKPRDENGNERLGLEPSVDVELIVDGSLKTFKKIWAEIYKKKRGQTDNEYSGNESKCYIDEVPTTLTEFQNEIDGIISEKLFKMITNVNHFINLHWREQREIIFKLVPDVKDQEIIDAHPELAKLEEILNGKNVEDLKKIYKDRNIKINKDLDTLPARLDELHKTDYPLLKGKIDVAEIDKDLAECYKKLSDAEENKSKVSNSAEIDRNRETIFGFKDEIRKLEAKKADMILKAKEDKQAEIDKVRSDLRKTQNERDMLNITNATLQKRIDNGLNEIENEESRKKKLLDDYHVENKKTFTPENCSYCGQALPQNMVEDLEKKFNLEKANTLEDIITSGKECAANIEKYSAEVDKLLAERKANDDKTVGFNEKIAVITTELNSSNIEIANTEADTSEIDKEIDKVEKRIKLLEDVVVKLKAKTATGIYDQAITELKNTIEYLSDQKAQHNLKTQNDARIAELQNTEKKLRSDYEDNLAIVVLCEKFSSIKSKYLESKINTNFEIVKFELFKRYLNTGIEDTCVATVLSRDGNYVSYSSANNANKINAGLDIIRTLQKINEVKAPIFIDNAESTVKFLDLDCQLIKLYVSENDKELRIERE